MGRELDPARPFGRQIRRLVRRRLRDSVRTLDAAMSGGADDTAFDDAVHRVRRNTKEVRALVRLLDDCSGPTRRLDRLAHEAARQLGPLRDSSVAGRLASRFDAAPTDDPDPWPGSTARGALEGASDALSRAIDATDELPTPAGARELRAGLRRTYRSARRAHRRARHDPSVANVHHLRIRTKRLWYQIRALSIAAPSVLGPLGEVLDEVGELLGDVHDIDVFLDDHTDGIADDGRRSLEREREDRCGRALRLGSTVYVESADAFATRVVRLWRLAGRDGPEPAR